MSLQLVPVTLDTARRFVAMWHRRVHLRLRSSDPSFSTGLALDGGFPAEEHWALAVPTRLPGVFGADAEDYLSLEFLPDWTELAIQGRV